MMTPLLIIACSLLALALAAILIFLFMVVAVARTFPSCHDDDLDHEMINRRVP